VGVVHRLKSKYRKSLVQKAIASIRWKSSAQDMFMSMHFALAVVHYIALTMLTGILLV
jgi:hypothetical protein